MARTAKDPIPTTLRGEVWVRDDFRCHYCGSRWPLSVDHMIPESKGGTLELGNLVTSCVRCNSRKGTKTYEEFIEELTTDPVGRETVKLTETLMDGTRSTYEKPCSEMNINEAVWFICRRGHRKGYVLAKLFEYTRYFSERFGKRLRNRIGYIMPDFQQLEVCNPMTGEIEIVLIDISMRMHSIDRFAYIIRDHLCNRRPNEARRIFDLGIQRYGDELARLFSFKDESSL